MKRFIPYLFLLLATNTALAQNDTAALYTKFPNVPPFSFTRVPDSSRFVKADLKKNKAVLVIVFSPDCEHCQHELKDLIAHMNLFKDVQIVMVSHLDYHFIKTFYQDNKLAAYPNIIMGRDYSYFFGTFYKIKFLPAIFLYNKKGQFVKAFGGSVPVKKIAAWLK